MNLHINQLVNNDNELQCDGEFGFDVDQTAITITLTVVVANNRALRRCSLRSSPVASSGMLTLRRTLSKIQLKLGCLLRDVTER